MGTPGTLAGLPPPPPLLPVWAKVLWYAADIGTDIALGYLAYDYAQQINAAGSVAPEEVDRWQRIQIVVENGNSLDVADDYRFTFDVVNYTNGAIDSTWDAGDFTFVTQQLLGFVTAIRSLYPAAITFKEARFYEMAFNELAHVDTVDGKHHHFVSSGSPSFIGALNVPGTNVGGPLPPQVATTITEMVPSRPNWGRLYLPAMAVGTVGAAGRPSSATVDQIARAYSDAANFLQADDFFFVVPNVQASKNHTHTLSNVSGCRVDDVWDVIRRRRWAAPTYRKTYDVITPSG